MSHSHIQSHLASSNPEHSSESGSGSQGRGKQPEHARLTCCCENGITSDKIQNVSGVFIGRLYRTYCWQRKSTGTANSVQGQGNRKRDEPVYVPWEPRGVGVWMWRRELKGNARWADLRTVILSFCGKQRIRRDCLNPENEFSPQGSVKDNLTQEKRQQRPSETIVWL